MEEDKVINETLTRAGLIIGIISLLLLVATVSFYLGFRQGSMTTVSQQLPNGTSQNRDSDVSYQDDEAVFCTLDAKECPDGSWVGRVPPNCEFEACPGENGNTNDYFLDLNDDRDDGSVELNNTIELYPM